MNRIFCIIALILIAAVASENYGHGNNWHADHDWTSNGNYGWWVKEAGHSHGVRVQRWYVGVADDHQDDVKLRFRNLHHKHFCEYDDNDVAITDHCTNSSRFDFSEVERNPADPVIDTWGVDANDATSGVDGIHWDHWVANGSDASANRLTVTTFLVDDTDSDLHMCFEWDGVSAECDEELEVEQGDVVFRLGVGDSFTFHADTEKFEYGVRFVAGQDSFLRGDTTTAMDFLEDQCRWHFGDVADDTDCDGDVHVHALYVDGNGDTKVVKNQNHVAGPPARFLQGKANPAPNQNAIENSNEKSIVQIVADHSKSGWDWNCEAVYVALGSDGFENTADDVMDAECTYTFWVKVSEFN